jgi:hypothetical protein
MHESFFKHEYMLQGDDTSLSFNLYLANVENMVSS